MDVQTQPHIERRPVLVSRGLVLLALIGTPAGCGGPSDAGRLLPSARNDLNAMDTATVTVDGHTFQVWIAADHESRQLGLMQVSQDELAPLPDGTERGMLFIFPDERPLSFWMFNTVIPLDIAYIRGDGRVVRTYTMAPRETRTYPSFEPAQFALEVSAGVFEQLGIGPGSRVEFSDDVLKHVP